MRHFLLLIAFVFGCAPATAQTGSATTTVILVRHAEKAAEPADDPSLTAAGEARARALVSALRAADIDAIYSTQFVRTRATAAALAEAAGVDVTIVAAGAGAPDYVSAVAERARTEHPGGVVVIVGHSNTLGRTVAALGGPDDLGDLPDAVHDAMYILLLTEGREPRLITARYGAPSEK